MAQNNVQIAISASDQASGTMDRIQQRFAEMNRTTEQVTRKFTEMNSALSSLGGALSLASVGLMTKSFIDAGLQVEKLNKLFSAAAGSANLGAREFEYIRGVSEKMGLQMTTAAESYGKWMASVRNTTLEGEKGRKVFESVSGATTALGLSADETKGVFLALSQMMSKGKIQAEELRGQLGERLPGAFKLTADAMGITTAELDKMLKDGKVIADDVLPKLAAQLDKTYGVAATEGARGAAAEMNRLNNAMLETKAAAGAALMPVFVDIVRGLKPAVELLRDFIGGLQLMASEASAIPYKIKNAMGGSVKKTALESLPIAGLPIKAGNWLVDKLTGGMSMTSAEIKASLEDQQSGIMKRYLPTGSDYTAAELARQRGIKPMKLTDEKKSNSDFNSMITSFNSFQRKVKDAGSALDNALAQNAFDAQKLVDALEINPEKTALAAKGITKAAILSLRDQIANQIKNTDWEKRMVELGENGTLQSMSDKAVFNIATMQQGDLSSAKRYKITNPMATRYLGGRAGYSMMTDNQYGVTQQVPPLSQEQIQAQAEKARRLMSGLGTEVKSANGDTYGANMDALENQHQTRLEMIESFAEKEKLTNEQKNAAMLKADEAYAASKAALQKKTWEDAATSLGGSLSTIGNIMMQGNKEQFEAGKAMAIAGATVSMISGSIKAFTSCLSIPYVGVALGAIAAAAVIAQGTMQIAQIESTQYQARALGGSVAGRNSYLVGERGPELFTPYTDGMITPNNKLGGSTVAPTIVYQISTGVTDTVRAEIMRLAPALTQHAVNAVHGAMRQGQFQGA